MGSILSGFGGKGTFSRGIHPPERKLFAAEAPIEVLPAPEKIVLPLSQHIGAPCKATVKTKQEISTGDVIGEAGGFVSAPVHSSISGKVMKSTNVTLPTGRRVSAVPVQAESEFEQT